jgi:hypothetical protein
VGGELVLDQVLTRLQLTADDHFDDDVEDRVP